MTRDQFIRHVESTQKEFRRFLAALCCGDIQLSEDIAQEAYMKAYLSCDGFGSPDRFKAWIFRIGYNTFINHRRTVRSSAGYDEAATLPAADTADATFRYQPLYAALDRLPPKERTSILLFYMEGYSVREISQIVDASADAVKQHLTRGRTRLRGLLISQQ